MSFALRGRTAVELGVSRFWLRVGTTEARSGSARELVAQLQHGLMLNDPSAISAVERIGELIGRGWEPSVTDDWLREIEYAFEVGSLSVAACDALPLDPFESGMMLSDLAPAEPIAERPRPATTSSWLEVVVVDEIGEPLPEIDLEIAIAGSIERVRTDDGGVARIDELPAGTARVGFADPSAVRKVLRPRWDLVREGEILREAPGLSVVQLHDDACWVIPSGRRHVLSLQPRVIAARLRGALFDLNKSFLLPSAIPSLRRLASLYAENEPAALLVVGHTDRAGKPSVNDPLSLERADSMAAFLTDDVDVWLSRYGTQLSEKRRWGKHEDLLMLSTLSLVADAEPVLDADAVRRFQVRHNAIPEARRSPSWAPLEEDGVLGSGTRRQLIGDYMHQDGTTLPDDVDPIEHGCGENFPVDESGEELDDAAEDGVRDALDRRVELFFFDRELGIQPPSPGKNSPKGSTAYPEWRRRAQQTLELEARAHGPLELMTWSPGDEEVRLCIEDANGELIADLGREHGELDGELLCVSVLPEALPAEVALMVLRNGEIEHRSDLMSPADVRDALYRGDLDRADGRAVSNSTEAKLVPTDTVSASSSTAQARMSLRWNNGDHRMLKRMEVRVAAGPSGTELLPVESSTGVRSFDIPEDATHLVVELSIESDILMLQQEFEVKRSGGGNVRLKAVRSNSPDKQHPRIESVGVNAGKPSKAVIPVKIDLEFLDLTSYLQRTSSNFRGISDAKIESGIRVLEHTKTIKGRNTVWPVLLPPTLGVERRQGVLMFFKNEATDRFVHGKVMKGAYANADSANYQRALPIYWGAQSDPGKFVMDSPTNYFRLPVFGWDAQLRAAKRSVVVFFPIPHGTSFGALDAPSDRSRKLIDSAFRCLWAEGHIARSKRVDHLAVGSFSSGNTTLYTWAKASQKNQLVQELWVFDGKAGGFKADFAAWFDGDKTRRLRVFGTANTEYEANKLKHKIGPQANVTVEPGDPNYWYKSGDYIQSLTPADGPPFRLREDEKKPVTSNDASSISNVFVPTQVIDDHGTWVDQKLALSSPGLPPVDLLGFSNEEAATFITFGGLKAATKGAPVTNAAEFAALVAWLRDDTGTEPHRANRHRHGWSVIGGTFPGGKFKGYFQMCLEESGFRKA